MCVWFICYVWAHDLCDCGHLSSHACRGQRAPSTLLESGAPLFLFGATFCGPELLCRSVPLSLPPILPQEHWDRRCTHAHTHIWLLGLRSVIWTQVARYTWQAPLATEPFPKTYFYVVFYEVLLVWNTIHGETININGSLEIFATWDAGEAGSFLLVKTFTSFGLIIFFLCGWNQKPGGRNFLRSLRTKYPITLWFFLIACDN